MSVLNLECFFVLQDPKFLKKSKHFSFHIIANQMTGMYKNNALVQKSRLIERKQQCIYCVFSFQDFIFWLLQQLQWKSFLLGFRLHQWNMPPLWKYDVTVERGCDWSRELGCVYVVEGSRGWVVVLCERTMCERGNVYQQWNWIQLSMCIRKQWSLLWR